MNAFPRQIFHGLLGALRSVGVDKPHFIRDYNLVLAKSLAGHGFDRAMQRSVGGEYDAVGRVEASLLASLGLKNGDSVVDVGCGSGRLSTALARRFDIRYHGTDILEPFLDYAKDRAPAHYRFTRVGGLDIPEVSGSADFVTLFSVATHLMHHETYLYLEEAKRVARAGGHIVVSFIEIGNPHHWPIFEQTVEKKRKNKRSYLNAFIEASVVPVWAAELQLEVVAIHRAGERWIPLDETITFEDGTTVSGQADLGQSVAIMRKPTEAADGK